MRSNIRTVGLLWLFVAIVVLSAVIRIWTTGAALVSSGPPLAAEDAAYVAHPLASALHLFPGLGFACLGPLQFAAGLRARRPSLHRLIGRVFVLAGVVIAGTGVFMNVMFPPVGGALKSSAIYAMALTLLVSLACAMSAIWRRDVPRHRAYMVRAFAAGTSVATQRLFFLPLFVLRGMPDGLTIGVGMWGGLLINLAVAEVWVLRRRSKVSVGP